MLRPKVLLVLILAALLAAPSALAQTDEPPEEPTDGDPTEGALGDIIPPDDETAPVPTEQVEEATAEVLADAPAAEGSFLSELLGGAADLLTGAGSAIIDGITGAFSALGSGIAWLFTSIGRASISIVSGAASAVVWSVTTVTTIMVGIVTGTGRLLIGAVSGSWHLVEGALAGYAAARPEAVPSEAWAGGAAAGTAAASTGAQYGIYRWLKHAGWLTMGIPLFTRIKKEDILDHPMRSLIYDTIKANPGIHVSALARTVDAGWGTTVHHLKKLHEKELVAVRTVNNQKCYFENGGRFGRTQWEQIPELKNGTAQRVAQFILNHPLQPLTGISGALGISPSLVSHHVTKLERAGILKKVRDGRFVKITVTEEARRTLFEQGMPGFVGDATPMQTPSGPAAA